MKKHRNKYIKIITDDLLQKIRITIELSQIRVMCWQYCTNSTQMKMLELELEFVEFFKVKLELKWSFFYPIQAQAQT